MTTTAPPARLTLCGGRLTGEPLTQTITLYDGTPARWFLGRRWQLDGRDVHPVNARAFHEQWLSARRRGEPAADWRPPGW